MRKGKVFMYVEYIVDLDDDDMVNRAKDYLYDDIRECVLHEYVDDWIDIKELDSIEASELEVTGCLIEESI